MEIIVSAKDRQTAEANKKASLLEELDKERETQEKSAKDRQTAEANKKASLLEELDKERETQEKKEKQESDVTLKSAATGRSAL
jgi:hypothetical protein